MHALLFNMKLSVKLQGCTITWILCYNVANVHNKWIPVEDMQVWGVGRIASEEVFSCRPILSCNLKDPKGAEWGRAWSWIHVHTLEMCVSPCIFWQAIVHLCPFLQPTWLLRALFFSLGVRTPMEVCSCGVSAKIWEEKR